MFETGSIVPVVVAWARQQSWWPIAREVFMTGGNVSVFVPSLPAELGTGATIRHKQSGGLLAVLVAPVSPWGIVVMPPGAKLIRPVELGNLFKNIPIGEA